MADVTLANGTLSVNNDSIAYEGGSLKYKGGKGDIKLIPQCSGGNSISMVMVQDITTMKSSVSFGLRPTKANLDRIKDWQASIEGNSILISNVTFNETFRGMYIIKDPEITLSPDGVITVEFEGTPTV